MTFDFYVAPGVKVWAASAGAGGAGSGAEGWRAGTVVGLPAEELGRWPVRIEAEGPGDGVTPAVEWLKWGVLLPRRSSGGGALAPPSAPALAAGAAATAAGPAAAASAGGLTQSALSTSRAAYRRAEFEQKAARHWDLFYRSNTVNFFKDRQ